MPSRPEGTGRAPTAKDLIAELERAVSELRASIEREVDASDQVHVVHDRLEDLQAALQGQSHPPAQGSAPTPARRRGATPGAFQSGDIVRLLAGSGDMTVIVTTGEMVHCQWFLGADLQQRAWPAFMLRLVRRARVK